MINRTLKRYVVIGLTVYVCELLIIFIATTMGMQPLPAVAISYWFGLILSFGLQKFITFGDKRLHHKIVLPQIMAYGLLVLFNFLFTIGATKLLEHSLPTAVIRTLALAMTTLWNFYLYKHKIFRINEVVID